MRAREPMLAATARKNKTSDSGGGSGVTSGASDERRARGRVRQAGVVSTRLTALCSIVEQNDDANRLRERQRACRALKCARTCARHMSDAR